MMVCGLSAVGKSGWPFGPGYVRLLTVRALMGKLWRVEGGPSFIISESMEYSRDGKIASRVFKTQPAKNETVFGPEVRNLIFQKSSAALGWARNARKSARPRSRGFDNYTTHRSIKRSGAVQCPRSRGRALTRGAKITSNDTLSARSRPGAQCKHYNRPPK